MAKTRLFGESISPGVIKQLERRAEVLSRGVRNSNDLRYLNEKTSWVRMISGVDTQDAENNFTSEEAKSFILSGGELEWDGKRFIRRRGFNTGNIEEERGRYNYDKDLGIRPEAGITSFSIKHIGTYGVLREANITFNVWTRNDLEKAQSLFLRPGMSVIVEWGNSLYLDNEGNVRDTFILPDYDKYFSPTTTSVKLANIFKKAKEDNSFNYNGFFGYINNFSWSFRPDGGYDCSIKAITKGAVLESLSCYKSTSQALADAGQSRFNITSNNTNKKENRTYLHYVGGLLSGLFNSGNDSNDRLQEFNSNVTELLKKENIDVSKPFFYYIKNNENDLNKEVAYISLRTFCALLNIAFSFRTPNGDSITSFYVNSNEDEFLEPSYCTFSGHFSLNPFFCILPKFASIDLKDEEGKDIRKEIGLEGIHQQIVIDSKEEDKFFNLYGIHINLFQVIEDLDSLYVGAKEPSKVNVFDFLKIVLNKINSTLGSINSFDLSFDEDLQKWIIVDRNSIFPPQTQADTSTRILPKINVTGLKSSVLDLSLETLITPSLSSQIAISAQASNSTLNANINLPLQEWNSNVVDRFSNADLQNQKITDTKKNEGRFPQGAIDDLRSSADNANGVSNQSVDQNTIENIKEYLRTFFVNSVENLYEPLNYPISGENNTAVRFNGRVIGYLSKSSVATENLEEVLFEKFKADAISRFNLAVNGTPSSSVTTNNTGLIPIQLTLTLEGISGMKIGQIFSLGNISERSNILPEIYDSYGFIITGIDNTINQGKWVSSIKGLTFKTERSSKQAKEKI